MSAGRNKRYASLPLLGVSLLFLLTGECHRTSEVIVRIRSNDGRPIAGAMIEGGVDWEHFRDTTDELGVAVLPAHAAGWGASVSATNYEPKRIEKLTSGAYTLSACEVEFARIDAADGYLLRFRNDTLLTITYQGEYHAYLLDSGGLTEVASADLATTAGHRQIMRGDTLWFEAHDEGVYAYSLANVATPALLQHYPIPDYVLGFAVCDSAAFVAGGDGDQDSARLFACWPTGECSEVARLRPGWQMRMAVTSHYLVITGYDPTVQIFDIQSPRAPKLVAEYNGSERWSGLPYHDWVVLRPPSHYPSYPSVDYKLLDLRDPVNPVESGPYAADSTLIKLIADDSTMIGHHVIGGLAILRGSLQTGFRIAATVAPNSGFDGDIGGCAPPYYLLAGYLWKSR